MMPATGAARGILRAMSWTHDLTSLVFIGHAVQ